MIFQDSQDNHSESMNLSDYDFSKNSDTRTPPFSWKEKSVKKQDKPKNRKLEKTKNSEKEKKSLKSMKFWKPIRFKQSTYDSK